MSDFLIFIIVIIFIVLAIVAQILYKHIVEMNKQSEAYRDADDVYQFCRALFG